MSKSSLSQWSKQSTQGHAWPNKTIQRGHAKPSPCMFTRVVNFLLACSFSMPALQPALRLGIPLLPRLTYHPWSNSLKAYYFARNVSEHSTTTWGKGVFRPKAPQMRLSWVKKHKTLFEFGCWRRTPHLNIVSWTCVVWLVVGGHLISFDMGDDTWTISVFALGEAIETSAHQKLYLAAGLVPCDQL